MIKTQILRYINNIGDIDYLATIVNAVSASELWEIIDQLLQSEDNETIDLTCLFIRDLVLFSSRHPDCEKFVKDYPQSCVVKTLEQLVCCTNHFTRHQVIYTLGKTCCYDSVNVLNQAFIELRDSDPILLPRLIGEMGWLGAENFWELIDSMMMSQVYVTRWAVIAILGEFGGDDPQEQNELFKNKYKLFNQLRKDSNSLVQLEAEYNYQLLKFRSEAYNLPKAERRKQRKNLERQYKPKLDFFYISLAFSRYLYTNGLKQYSIPELEEFIKGL